MHVGDALVALGGAFLAAAVLARLGARIGLPTIPLFMLAGIVFGPHTPGVALVEDPDDLALSPRSAWSSCSSTWAWSFTPTTWWRAGGGCSAPAAAIWS